MFTEIQMYGPRHESRILPWAQCHIFLETLFICNDIDKNLNKNFQTYSSYHSFELLFLLFQICVISRLKNWKIKNGPRQDTFP